MLSIDVVKYNTGISYQVNFGAMLSIDVPHQYLTYTTEVDLV
jgi:hypothetical protein